MTARKPRPRKPASKATTTTQAPATARTRGRTKTDAAAGSKAAAASENGGYAGFGKGSASEAAAVALLKGGLSRTDVMTKLRSADEQVNGSSPLSQSWSVAISNVVAKLVSQGWVETGTYKLVPPKGTDVNVPDGDDTYMPKFDPSVPRRGRRRGVPQLPKAAAPTATKTRPAKTKAKPAEVATEAAPAKTGPARRARRGRPRKAA